MLTDTALRAKVDQLWDKLWTGGLSNPLDAIEQFSYLLFFKRLDDEENKRENAARRRGEVYAPRFDDDMRWRTWCQYGADQMLSHVREKIFPRLKSLGDKGSSFERYMQNAEFKINKASLLVEACKLIDSMQISSQNQDVQGDLYEYMLSKLNTAGRNGQFRTPRHIIRMMVQMIDPKPDERIGDLAAGTAGFLVNAFQHILAQHTPSESLTRDEEGDVHGADGSLLTEEQRAFLQNGALRGYDNDSGMTMLRIGSMNLMLHGLSNPRFFYADTLSKGFDEPKQYDVILMNPPFTGAVDANDISPRLPGGTTKSELLFVHQILEVLDSGGRAAVIVPDGVLSGSTNAHKELRKRLIEENHLDAVISMHSSVFKPYAAVSTAVLVFRKGGRTERTWMYQLNADGFSKDALREPVAENDIPDLLCVWTQRMLPEYAEVPNKHRWVTHDELRANDYSLVTRVYLTKPSLSYDLPNQTIGELCTVTKGSSPAQATSPGPYPLVTTSGELKSADVYQFEGEAVCVPLVSSTGHGHASIKRLTFIEGKFAAATIVAVLQVRDTSLLSPKFLYYFLEAHKDELLVPLMRGAANVSLSVQKIASVKIPLPAMDQQIEIISNLDQIDANIVRARTELQELIEAREIELKALTKEFSTAPQGEMDVTYGDAESDSA